MTASMRLAVVVAAIGVPALLACERSGGTGEASAKTARRDTLPERPPIVPERCATMPASWTDAVTPAAVRAAYDSARAAADTTRAPRGDSLSRDTTARADTTRPRPRAAAAKKPVVRDTFPTPPTALPGSVLPGCRIVAYYGNPLSKRMGVLGQYPPAQMLAKLDSQARGYERADTTMPIVRALELITPVAQGSPGPKQLWRMRMPDTLIEN
ncbi:MAG TPA: hypothetical protein VHM30_19785, partial [Gemmatimonadaceae bacterium]|nr:hypothetical protein [Gemmatimonadaceae bacterium]